MPRLAKELKNELLEIKGFSERNILRMTAFYREYPEPSVILPQVAAELRKSRKLPQVAADLRKSRKLPQAAAVLRTPCGVMASPF